MKILMLTENQSGCFKYRSQIPKKALEKRGHIVKVISSRDDLEKNMIVPDAVIFYRGYNGDVADTARMFKAFGIRIIFDTDDAMEKVKKDNVHYFDTITTLESAEWLARNANMVTTTTLNLASYLSKFNGNVAIIPNCLDLDEWKLRKFGNKKLRIGWTGGASHLSDLNIILDVIRDLQRRYDFEFVINGMSEVDLNEWYKINYEKNGLTFENSVVGKEMKRMLVKLSKIKYEFHPWTSIDKYAQKVSDINLDIGLCPLVASDFNNKKSCIKFYEYAAVGTLTLASNVPPYNTELQYLAKNNYYDWKDKLEYLIKNFSEDLYEPQRDWVLKNRNIEDHIQKYEYAYANDKTNRGGDKKIGISPKEREVV